MPINNHSTKVVTGIVKKTIFSSSINYLLSTGQCDRKDKSHSRRENGVNPRQKMTIRAAEKAVLYI
jgi:hypothetical protein